VVYAWSAQSEVTEKVIQVLAEVKDKHLQRGQFRWQMTDKMSAIVWKDKRIVHCISTIHKQDVLVHHFQHLLSS
jgi:hypothetical protein